MRTILATAIVLVTTLGGPVAAGDEDCRSCHSREGAASQAPELRDKLAAMPLIGHGEASAGRHGSLTCRECHGQTCDSYPHAADARTAILPCEKCHEL